ncbi:MAG: hypothetical protein M0Z77_04555 [Thermoplasmatales archaeon]|nr:hypothetical protein [Thermoplasmatales archaeon]
MTKNNPLYANIGFSKGEIGENADLYDLLKGFKNSDKDHLFEFLVKLFERLQVSQFDSTLNGSTMNNARGNAQGAGKQLKTFAGDKREMTKLSIKGMKARIKKEFPDSDLAKLMDSEPDWLSPAEFLAKAPIWVSLAEIEGRRQK